MRSRFSNGLGINSFKGFAPDKAKQFVPCSHDGYVIGDVILFYLAENQFNLVGRAPDAQLGAVSTPRSAVQRVTCTYDERTAARPDPQNRRHYRYQLQGPNASKVHRVGDRPPGAGPQVLQHVRHADRRPRGARAAPRHGRTAGLRTDGPLGRRPPSFTPRWSRPARRTACGWSAGAAIPRTRWNRAGYPRRFPAVYTGEKMKPYREWLTVNHYEAKASIGGSFVSDNIEDYYLTPWDLGYGPFVKFDHEFIGRAALEKMAAGPHRKKVTLALDNVSVTDALFTMFDEGLRAKFIEFPSAVYSMHPFDRVTVDGKLVGLSTWIGYSANEGKMLTLAMLDEQLRDAGHRGHLRLGRARTAARRKPAVERHKQVEIKAVVSPVPYSNVARTAYADSWRNRSK